MITQTEMSRLSSLVYHWFPHLSSQVALRAQRPSAVVAAASLLFHIIARLAVLHRSELWFVDLIAFAVNLLEPWTFNMVSKSPWARSMLLPLCWKTADIICNFLLYTIVSLVLNGVQHCFLGWQLDSKSIICKILSIFLVSHI